jgi:hypothetical protein
MLDPPDDTHARADLIIEAATGKNGIEGKDI